MKRKIEISSDCKNFPEVENFLNVIFKEENLSRKLFCKIYLSVSEAVNNAILHGNCSDFSKKVKLDYSRDNLALYFTISDEGNGFDISKVVDPTLPHTISNESGRGIFIMKKYSDGVDFYENGKIVRLTFYNKE
jgi:serine/threonine-protein kinase RsbW